MQEWLETIFSALIGSGVLAVIIKYFWSRQKASAARQAAIEEGVKALLHDRLIIACTEALERDSTTSQELENIEYLYKPYASLGGNGTGETLYKRVKNLPITAEDEAG